MLLCLAALTNPQSRNGSVSDFTFVAIVILRQARLDGTDATQKQSSGPTRESATRDSYHVHCACRCGCTRSETNDKKIMHSKSQLHLYASLLSTQAIRAHHSDVYALLRGTSRTGIVRPPSSDGCTTVTR